jgi:hypothetical protein
MLSTVEHILTIRRSCKDLNGSAPIAVSKPQEVVPPLLSVADEARSSFGFLHTLSFQLQNNGDTYMGAWLQSWSVYCSRFTPSPKQPADSAEWILSGFITLI